MEQQRYLLDQKCKDVLINRLKTELGDLKKDGGVSHYSSFGNLKSPAPFSQNQFYNEPILDNSNNYQLSNLQKLYEELKERLYNLNSECDHYRSVNKEQEVEISSLKNSQKENQSEIKALNSEVSKIKRQNHEAASEIEVQKFRVSKDQYIVSESKTVLEDYRNEIANSQQKYLDVKRDFDSAKYTIDEQDLLLEQSRKEQLTFQGRLMGRDEEIELQKIKCVTLKDESNLIKTKKADLERIIDNLVLEINQLQQDDEACRRIQERKNDYEKLKSRNESFGSRTPPNQVLGSTYRSRLDNSYV